LNVKSLSDLINVKSHNVFNLLDFFQLDKLLQKKKEMNFDKIYNVVESPSFD